MRFIIVMFIFSSNLLLSIEPNVHVSNKIIGDSFMIELNITNSSDSIFYIYNSSWIVDFTNSCFLTHLKNGNWAIFNMIQIYPSNKSKPWGFFVTQFNPEFHSFPELINLNPNDSIKLSIFIEIEDLKATLQKNEFDYEIELYIYYLTQIQYDSAYKIVFGTEDLKSIKYFNTNNYSKNIIFEKLNLKNGYDSQSLIIETSYSLSEILKKANDIQQFVLMRNLNGLLNDCFIKAKSTIFNCKKDK